MYVGIREVHLDKVDKDKGWVCLYDEEKDVFEDSLKVHSYRIIFSVSVLIPPENKS